MKVTLENKTTQPFTLIYLISKNKILLLKSITGKQLLKSRWIGIGGKIEPGETLLESVVREFKEETNLTLNNPVLRGTWTWIEEPDFVGTLYIFFASQYTGRLISNSREGELKWHNLKSVEKIKDFVPHQLLFFPQLIKQKTFFFSGLAVYSKTNKLKLVVSNQ